MVDCFFGRYGDWMNQEFEPRVIRVLSAVVNLPVEQLSGDSGPDTVPGWDSASHLRLVLALEAEVGTAFTDEEVTDMLSVNLICTILGERQNAWRL